MISQIRQLLLLTLFSFLLPAYVLAQEDSLAEESVDVIISIDEIAATIPADYAMLIININGEYQKMLNESLQTEYRHETNSYQKDFDDLTNLTNYVLEREQIFSGTQSLIEQWGGKIDGIGSLAEEIKARADELIQLKKTLSLERGLWTKKQNLLSQSETHDEVLRFITTAEDTLSHFIQINGDEIDTCILLYSHLAELYIQSQQQRDELDALRKRNLDSLLYNRSIPIWEVKSEGTIADIKSDLNYLRTIGAEDAKMYLKSNIPEIRLVLLIFLVFLSIFYWTRSRSLAMSDDNEPEIVRNVHILRRPFMMSLFVTVIANTFILTNKPPILIYFMAIIVTICLLSILLNMVKGPSRVIIYQLIILFLAYNFIAIFGLGNAIARYTLLGSNALLLFVLYKIQKDNKNGSQERDLTYWARMYKMLARPFMILIGIGFIATILGYDTVSLVLFRGVLFSLLIGLMLVAAFESLASIIFHSFGSRFAMKSNLISEDGELIFKNLIKILGIAFMLLYVYYVLEFFLLWGPVADNLEEFWKFGFEFGSVEITVGKLVGFFFIILLFWLIGVAIRKIMDRELFQRIRTPRGVGNAVGSVLLYALIVIGFFLALAFAGFDITHLGILAGALGVGIGFGLQTIVNNFLSGLILVFERPVTVGDIVEVDQVLGRVTSIGIRSSRILQFNGDEAIIPNADLISKQVTNRTLSSHNRRYRVRVATNRKEHPDRVIELLNQTVQQVDGVLEDPPVKTYLDMIDDQALRFYLDYWGDRDFLVLKSNVERAVFNALQKEEITMPIPIQFEIQKEDLS